jgi:hypothetical protein
MWRVRQLASRQAKPDFSSSGQASRQLTQVIADGILLANATELSSWNERRVQVIVCESCGVEHCQPGGWLAPRLAGLDVVFAPAFSDMIAGESERREYAPPAFVADRGVPLLDEDAYASFCKYAGELPLAKDLPVLSGADLVRCLQWEAPLRVLGSFPAPIALRRECLLAVSEGDLAETAEALDATIRQLAASESVAIRPILPGTTTRTFYLDGQGTLEWPVVAVDAAGTAYIQAAAGRIVVPSESP